MYLDSVQSLRRDMHFYSLLEEVHNSYYIPVWKEMTLPDQCDIWICLLITWELRHKSSQAEETYHSDSQNRHMTPQPIRKDSRLCPIIKGRHTLQRQNAENLKQIFPEKEYRGLSPNFHFHMSVSKLYIPTMGLPVLLEEICRLILEIYKSFKDTWMWKLGLRPRYSQKRNI
jgi:hypothetical protein